MADIKIVSFDCAIKNFAWVELTIKVSHLLAIKSQLTDLHILVDSCITDSCITDSCITDSCITDSCITDDSIASIKRSLSSISDQLSDILSIDFDLCDLTRDTASGLTKSIGCITASNLPAILSKRTADIWLIERQPGKLGKYNNNDALIIGHQIEYHAYHAGYEPIFMSPKLKNNIVFHPSCGRDIKDYKQRKQQAVANFKWLIATLGIKINKKLPKKLDDIADAFIQIFAWFRYKK